MTITTSQPTVPTALPEEHPLRRPGGRSASSVGHTRTPGNHPTKTGSGRYLSLERQDLAADYFNEKQVAKLERAYSKMSSFILAEFIDRLEHNLVANKSSNPRWDEFRLEIALKAQIRQEAEGFRLPVSGDIPRNSSVSFRRKFLQFSIKAMENELKQEGDYVEHEVLRDHLRIFKDDLRKYETA